MESNLQQRSLVEPFHTRSWVKDVTYNGGTLYYQELDGQRIAYHSSTEFLVQVGRGRKGSYRTKYAIVGNLAKAVMYYNGINLGPKWKKRLVMPACSRNPVLAQQSFSGLP
jgi:Tfp pilus tip-associated adhesin PilY1